MATALHSARTRFFDKCGKPLCGGTVHTYQVGSTTAKPTYTDASKTAVNTNPVILDSIGSAAIFLDGAYRVRVLDRNGMLVEDIAYIESWIAATEKDKIYENITTNKSLIDTHINKLDNPHQVTKAQVGLGNVDNTADLDKPISTSAESALSTKANKVDVYTKDETTGLINGIVTSNVSGHKGYLTLADAQAAQANLPSNTVIEVTNDPNSTNNGAYLWDGTTLAKSKYDPITYMNNNVRSVLGITRGVNIIDLTKRIDGMYVSYTDGNFTYLSGHNVLGHYEVEPNTKYRVSSWYNQQFAFYDADKNYISGMPYPNPDHTFTTPPNAKYIAITNAISDNPTFMLAKASEYPSYYKPFSYLFNQLELTAKQVNDLNDYVVDSLGLYVTNIIKKDGMTDGRYIDYTGGNVYRVGGHTVTDFLKIKPSTTYKTSSNYNQQFAFYDSGKKYISGMSYPNPDHTFTTPINAAYARFTVPNDVMDTLVITEAEYFPSTYVPFGYAFKIKANSKTTDIWVSADTSDSDSKVKFKGNNAIQLALDSITDATTDNRYVIRVKQGLYKITTAQEFLGYRGYPSMIATKDFVDIIGQGQDNTIVWAELPYNDNDIGASINGNTYARDRYQTLYDYSNSLIKDIMFVGKNIRYTAHIDDLRGKDKTRNHENVGMIFKGDIGSGAAYGCGTSSGERTFIKGGRSYSDKDYGFASHNNIAFDKPSSWSFTNHEFGSLTNPHSIFLQSDGSLVHDSFEMIGCSFAGTGYGLLYVEVWLSANTSLNRDSFNHAEWHITGHGNSPFLFENTVAGQSLLFTSSQKGLGNAIRFDTSSSAYPVLIKNNHANTTSSLYNDNREYVDGYIVQDGSIDLAAKAWGCKDLSDIAYWYDSGVKYTSLAKRLGDCSTNNLELKVIVNGATATIVFNKNYSNMSNAQIIAEMQAQISGVTISLVSYGRDYYPTITDVTERVYNNGNTYIAKGSLVTKQGGFVRLANANDKVFGVALDDIPVIYSTSEGVKKGEGRVLKRGYISADRAKAHFVLADNHSPSIGTQFSVSNGQLVTDSNGKISIDIDASVVSINC